MKCAESLELLQQRLDGDTANVPALEQHLRECAPCREMHRAGLMLVDAARELPRATPSAQLTNRIVQAVLDDRRTRMFRLRFAAAAALAASVLIAAIAYVNWPNAANQAPIAENKQRPKEQAPAIVKVEPKSSLEDSVAEVGVAMSSLTERIAGQTREQAEILWQATAPVDLTNMTDMPPTDDMTEPLAPAAEPLRNAGQGVSHGLETVARSAQRAVDFFFREFGAAEKETPN